MDQFMHGLINMQDFGTYHICAKASLKHPAVLEVQILVFIYIHTLCVRSLKALASSLEASLLNNAISTKLIT